MAKIQIVKLAGDEGYTLSDGNEESEEYACWGEPLNATLGGKQYLAHCDIDDEGQVINVSDALVYEVTPLNDADVEVVEVEDDEGEAVEA